MGFEEDEKTDEWILPCRCGKSHGGHHPGAPGGPQCGCGRPSVYESGACEDCGASPDEEK